jgi:rod shape determining protein RodA
MFKTFGSRYRQQGLLESLHIDPLLFFLLSAILTFGLFILYSAADQDLSVLESQIARVGIAILFMVVLAQVPPDSYRRWAPIIFLIGIFLLIFVVLMGHVGKGAQRWLNLGFLRFQPSQLIIISLPLLLCWYLGEKPLPPSIFNLLIATLIILIPSVLVAKQPDLGTAIVISLTGFGVLILAGLRTWIIATLAGLVAASLPFAWHFMRPYQKARVTTFLNPESDPLGASYQIIQSKIAIGSGGLLGKGWLNGTQSHLQFLPEHKTDVIFAVCGEEFGLIGCALLTLFYFFVVLRCFYVAAQAQSTFTRLLAASLGLTFFFTFFINIGMVSGILPVVGIPLPLVSYGGTSMVTAMAGFGILMSIHTHRKLLGS